MQHRPACSNCSRMLPSRGTLFDGHVPICEAFPERIPDKIWFAQHPHDTPVGGEEEGRLFVAADPLVGNPVRQAEAAE